MRKEINDGSEYRLLVATSEWCRLGLCRIRRIKVVLISVLRSSVG